jgi:hypothetical protein
MGTKWTVGADNDALASGRVERRCGRFRLYAWPDGAWAVDFREHRIRQCASGQELDSLAAAKATSEAVFRNILAEALGDFGEEP